MPEQIVLDIDDTFDRVHGEQQLRLFNAYHDDYGFQPIVVFDGEGRFVTALLRPGKRPGGREIAAFVRRLVGAIRAQWPRVEILLRADSHYAAPAVFDWCRVNRVNWVLGLASNPALRRHVAALEKTTAERFRAAPRRGKLRRFAQFYDAAHSLEPGRAHHRPGRGRTRGHRHPLYRDQSRRGPRQASLQGALLRARPGGEPHQGVEKPPRCRPNLLPRGRGQPVPPVPARRRLWLLWSMRRLMPPRSAWRVMQFDTLRLRLLKLAARVVELKKQVEIHLPSSSPDQAIFAMLLDRLPRLIT